MFGNSDAQVTMQTINSKEDSHSLDIVWMLERSGVPYPIFVSLSLISLIIMITIVIIITYCDDDFVVNFCYYLSLSVSFQGGWDFGAMAEKALAKIPPQWLQPRAKIRSW